MESLWKINHDIEALFEQGFDDDSIDIETGEIDNAKVTEAFDSLMLDRAEKIKNIAHYIKNLNAFIANSKEAEKAMSERRKTNEKRVEWLKGYVLSNMLKFGDKKIEDVDYVLSYRTSTSVDVYDVAAVPDEYKKTKVEISPDKTKIKDALKTGKEVAGARLTESQNLQVK